MLQSHKNQITALNCNSIEEECIKGEFFEQMAQRIKYTKSVIALLQGATTTKLAIVSKFCF